MFPRDRVELVADEGFEETHPEPLFDPRRIRIDDLLSKGINIRRLEQFRKKHTDRDTGCDECKKDQRGRNDQVVEEPRKGSHREVPVGDPTRGYRCFAHGPRGQCHVSAWSCERGRVVGFVGDENEALTAAHQLLDDANDAVGVCFVQAHKGFIENDDAFSLGEYLG